MCAEPVGYAGPGTQWAPTVYSAGLAGRGIETSFFKIVLALKANPNRNTLITAKFKSCVLAMIFPFL